MTILMKRRKWKKPRKMRQPNEGNKIYFLWATSALLRVQVASIFVGSKRLVCEVVWVSRQIAEGILISTRVS